MGRQTREFVPASRPRERGCESRLAHGLLLQRINFSYMSEKKVHHDGARKPHKKVHWNILLIL